MAMRSIREVDREKMKKVLSDLPLEIIANILARLPIKTILVGKLVCRKWREVVNSDSIFAETHYQISRLSVLTPESIFILINPRGFCYNKLRSSKLVGPGQSLAGFRVLNSCRGFLFLENHDSPSNKDTPSVYRSYSIYNPLTDEKVLLPRVSNVGVLSESRCCGLGLNSRTKQYKVIIFIRQPISTYKILVHTICKKFLIDNPWREVTLKEGYFNILKEMWDVTNKPLELNGVLHWRATGVKISCFDMDKEELSTMASPCARDAHKYLVSIGVFRGLLCFGIKDLANYKVEMWIMEKYGITDSWMKYVVVKEQFANIRETIKFSLYRPILIDVLDNGEIIILYQCPSYRLFSYDPIRGCLKHILLPPHLSKPWAEVYTPSFLSIK